MEPRTCCSRCRRPLSGSCFCDRVAPLPTRTRILLLQHPRERHVPIGTARMAHLALPDSTLRVGVDFSGDPEVRAVLAGSASFVLFPGADALPVEDLPRDRDLTIVVLDGTWWQARKLLKLNPAIASLPRVAFRPRSPSGYLIRKEPADHCVSTIEALAEVLEALEPEGDRFRRLLVPFHAMVDRQLWFESNVGSSRHRRVRPRIKAPPGAALAARLTASWSRLVCVHGEANARSSKDPVRQEPETIHWVAHRPSTGDTFESVVAPRRHLGPDTPKHVELSHERITTGVSVSAWHGAWREFARPDDVLVLWGTYYRDLARTDGLPLALPSLDMRVEAANLLRRRVGTLERCTAALDATPSPLPLDGRGGRRLSALVGVLEALRG